MEAIRLNFPENLLKKKQFSYEMVIDTKKNSIFIFILMVSLIFLFSCQPSLTVTKETISDISQDNITVNSQLPPANTPLPSGQEPQPSSPQFSTQCTDGWVCLTSTQKLHRLANCSFAERENCKFGCFNDSCKPAPVCTSGFKCKNKLEKGYQLEDCSWISRTKCNFGCQDAVCVPESNVTDAPSDSGTASPAPPAAPSYPMIAVGERKVITVGEKEHNLSIYLLEPDQVKLQLDVFKSEWILEGGNYTFGSAGVTFTIKGIFFQSFEGGKREVTYEVK